MPKTGTYLMLLDIFEGPRSMLLWSEKPKANKNKYTMSLEQKQAFTPPIGTPREGGSLRELSIIFFQESILGTEGKELEDLHDTAENELEHFLTCFL